MQDQEKLASFIKYGKRWIDYYDEFRKYSPPYNNIVLKIQGKTSKIHHAMDFLGQFSREALAEVRKNPTGKDSWIAKFALTAAAEDERLDDK